MEFQVSGILDDSIVSGKNGQMDIPVGTIFTKLLKYKLEGGIENEVRIACEEVASVEMKLVAVGWYHREIDHIPRGHTAGLKFSGNGLGKLKQMLAELKSNEQIYLKV